MLKTLSRWKRLEALALVALAAAGLVAAGPARAQTPVALELVLAVDSSSSVTSWEFDLQMQGLAQAFRDPGVQGAIVAAGDFGVAVSLVQWSGSTRQVLATEWHLVREPADADAFADLLDETPRFISGGSTAIGSAIEFSVNLIEFNEFKGFRKVIDISGDGRTNQGLRTTAMRDAAVAAGVTVNGLTILNEDPSVDHYYLRNVIGGTGAFIMTATDFRDFARAIRLKLIREIAGPPVAALPSSAQYAAGHGIR